jgi:hypothetical protein
MQSTFLKDDLEEGSKDMGSRHVCSGGILRPAT